MTTLQVADEARGRGDGRAWYVGKGRPGRDRKCDHCGKGYKARRSTSRFCSTSCRVAAWYAARGENGTYGNGTHGDGLPAGGVEGQ